MQGLEQLGAAGVGNRAPQTALCERVVADAYAVVHAAVASAIIRVCIPFRITASVHQYPCERHNRKEDSDAGKREFAKPYDAFGVARPALDPYWCGDEEQTKREWQLVILCFALTNNLRVENTLTDHAYDCDYRANHSQADGGTMVAIDSISHGNGRKDLYRARACECV